MFEQLNMAKAAFEELKRIRIALEELVRLHKEAKQ